MRYVALTVAALALASATGSAAAAWQEGSPSGLRGVVMRGPTKPVCRETEPCEAPAAGVVLRFARSGTVVARVRTSAAGAYRVLLRPGRYTVTTPQRGPGGGLIPRVVRVPSARVARVDFHLDTGIQ
jgi:hypothetical protein